MNKEKMEAAELSAKLWAMANDLRGTMEAYEFKNYILGLIFYKFLSDKTIKHFQEQLINDDLTYEQAWNDEEFHEDVIDESLERLGYVMEPQYLFSSMISLIEKNEAFPIFLINMILPATLAVSVILSKAS